MSLACFDTLVGLSSQDYACFTDERPDDYNVSDSGFYLTDADYGLQIIEACEVAGWGILSESLAQAIREIKTDLRASLRSRYDSGITAFSGVVAQLKHTGTQSASLPRVGMRIRTTHQKGMKFVLKKVFVGLNQSGTFSVQIQSNDPLFVAPAAFNITAVANTMTAHTLATEIELPLFSRSCEDDYLEYYISISRGSALPLNNKVTCCGAQPSWMRHFAASGFEASDNLASDGRFSSMGYGFALDGYLACEELDWLCEAEELGGYHVKDVLARTIQFRGAALSISRLIDHFSVSPCTGYQLESLNSKRNYLNTRAADNIKWISENVPAGATDCFRCKPYNTMRRRGIMV